MYVLDLLTTKHADECPYLSLLVPGLNLLAVPRAHLRTKADGAFAVVAPTLWKDLPGNVQVAISVDTLKRLLQTHLFKEASDQICAHYFNDVTVCFCDCLMISFLRFML